MSLHWIRDRRRRKLLETPVPPAWTAHLERNFAHWAHLDETERARVLDIARVLAAEKRWEGCGGLELTEEMVVTIAAQAALLLLGLPDQDFYRGVESVLVYPTGYMLPRRRVDPAGVVVEGPEAVVGTAVPLGAVVLSWRGARAGGRDEHDGRNLVFHEFAHALDMRDGAVDGTPPLDGRERLRTWFTVMTRHYEELRAAASEGRPSLLDPYGATNVAEFFAVATEVFFERAADLASEAPDLYAVLRDFYRQDPAARARGGAV
jgi:Mlc titration factor MtfA (ptsG expression regulator)